MFSAHLLLAFSWPSPLLGRTMYQELIIASNVSIKAAMHLLPIAIFGYKFVLLNCCTVMRAQARKLWAAILWASREGTKHCLKDWAKDGNLRNLLMY